MQNLLDKENQFCRSIIQINNQLRNLTSFHLSPLLYHIQKKKGAIPKRIFFYSTQMKHRSRISHCKQERNTERNSGSTKFIENPSPLESDLFRSKKKIESQTDQKIVKGRKRRGRGLKRSEREQEKRAPVYLFFRKVNKNFAGPASNEGTVDDGRAKCSWPTGQNEFVSIITLHPAVSHEPARGPVIQPSTGCSRHCSTDFLVNIKVVH